MSKLEKLTQNSWLESRKLESFRTSSLPVETLEPGREKRKICEKKQISESQKIVANPS